jgi:RHS repeat-associated protein
MPQLRGSGEAGPATLGLLRSEGGVTEQAAVKRKRMEIRPPSYTERIATKRREERTANNYGEERRHVYYYHGDHLGSAQVVTDYRGEVYEHIEYTPYGELWVEHAPNVEATPFRFTGKERDSETGLYYYGARYLNPQTGMWLSADPAMGEYIPLAPINDEARKYNENLPGMGGVFNTINLHVYHYAGNNPVKYIDPDGKTPYSIQLWKDYCVFSPSASTFEDGVFALIGYVPGASLAFDVISKVGGMRQIYPDTGAGKLKEAYDSLSVSLSGIQAGISLSGVASSLTKKIAVLGLILTTLDIVKALASVKLVGKDLLIERFLGDELTAKSHEGVAALYNYASQRFDDLVNSGDIKYETNLLGGLKTYAVSGLEELKKELRILRDAMNENPFTKLSD